MAHIHSLKGRILVRFTASITVRYVWGLKLVTLLRVARLWKLHVAKTHRYFAYAQFSFFRSNAAHVTRLCLAWIAPQNGLYYRPSPAESLSKPFEEQYKTMS